MELKASSLQPPLSPSDCSFDPEEKEISEDDDDDRNHKHRRREAQSQSLETEALEPTFNRPYRKRNKAFDDDSSRFGKRRSVASYPRPLVDSSQRARLNNTFYGDTGPGRGRRRDPGSWGQRDSRFSPIDVASPFVPQSPIPPGMFAGMGVPNVSSAPNTSWGAFGMVPGIANGGIDTLHPLGLQGTLRTPINAAVSMGVPRQRCRDFEERGFCLRGDMCPMEHGANRIVVEDVQSLSQLNLPVSLPSAHPLGNHAGQGADLYDPDQPLWTEDHPEISAAFMGLNTCNVDESEPLSDTDHTVRDLVETAHKFDERPSRCSQAAAGSRSSSIWGRIGSSKSKPSVDKRADSAINSSSNVTHETGKYLTQPNKQVNLGTDVTESSSKLQSDAGNDIHRPYQKAHCTLFISGIPPQDNKKESLLSHFRKFGEVIDIHIPLNSRRAFVQFSKREEAEAALRAPDAVMGNRFIKLWWANRDSVSGNGMNVGNNVPIVHQKMTSALVPIGPSNTQKGKDNQQPVPPKPSVAHGSVTPLPATDQQKSASATGSKALPPGQKNIESIELLKEELRKKQEMLDQKRKEFRNQLDKLQKQTSGLKVGASSNQVAGKLKGGTGADSAESKTPKPSDPGNGGSLRQPDVMSEDSKSAGATAANYPKPTPTLMIEPPNGRPSIRPLAPLGSPSVINRFKLDNRPTAFKIVPPLPSGLANVDVLKDHFSTYGGVTSVELDGSAAKDGSSVSETSKVAARIYFTTRHSAEKAFLNGKSWQGHSLQFMWLWPNNASKEAGSAENSSVATNNASVKPPAEDKSMDSLKASSSEFAESVNVEVRKNNTEYPEVDKDSKSSSSRTSSEQEQT